MVDLEINKRINDEYLMTLYGSVIELHVGGADQQELEQQGLSKSVGRDRGLSCWLWAIMLSLECMMNWEPSGLSTPADSWKSVSSSWRSQEAPCVGAVTSSTLLTWLRAGMCRGVRGGRMSGVCHVGASWRKQINPFWE